MKPTVEEQLQGTVRILESVVAPAVSESYARTILENLIANLRMLAVAAPKVAGFTRDDNDATLNLLMVLCEALPPEIVTRITQASAANTVDSDRERDQRNAHLRELLAEAVCSPRLTDDHHQLIKDYMVTRASRVPMRYVPTVAAADTSTTKR